MLFLIRGFGVIFEMVNFFVGFFKFIVFRLVVLELVGCCWKLDVKFVRCLFILFLGLRIIIVGWGVVVFFWGGVLGGIFIF